MNFELECECNDEVMEILSNNSYYTSSITNCILLLKKLDINDFTLTLNYETVKFENGILVEYTKGPISYMGKKLNVENSTGVGNEEVKDFLRKKEAIDNVDKVEISYIDNLIVGTYKFLSGKNPDFKDYITRNRIQVIAYFLSFVVSPIRYSTYYTRFNDGLPYNELIEFEMDKLQALTEEELDSLVIDENLEKNITALFSRLDQEFKDNSLFDIVKIHHEYYSDVDPSDESKKLVACIKNKKTN